jgi:hypothetical protein
MAAAADADRVGAEPPPASRRTEALRGFLIETVAKTQDDGAGIA